MKCPKCGFENPETQKFCGECGTDWVSRRFSRASDLFQQRSKR
ncbi:zinc-ribbon domain-containing protein [Thermodesulfobacteriota bacterium]